jgi:hypothetical protein
MGCGLLLRRNSSNQSLPIGLFSDDEDIRIEMGILAPLRRPKWPWASSDVFFSSFPVRDSDRAFLFLFLVLGGCVMSIIEQRSGVFVEK